MLNETPDETNPAFVYGTLEWERRKLTSVPIPVRKATPDNFEVITPEEAKRRYMAIYRKRHAPPKPVVLSVPRPPKAQKPVLKLVEAPKAKEPEPVTAPAFWTKPDDDVPAILHEHNPEPVIVRERDWLIVDMAPKVATIIRETAAHYGVAVEDVLSQRRTWKVMRPRQIAMYLAKVLTLRSLPDIGRRFGGRDHTTILHGVRKIEALIEAGDAKIIAEVAAIKERFGVHA